MARTSAPAPARAAPVHHALWRRSRAAVRDLWIGGVLLALIVAFSIDSPYFLTRANWLNTSSTATEVLLLAVGETFVICAGGIDLSVGAVLGFAGTAGAWVMSQLTAGQPTGAEVGAVALGFAAAVAAGLAFGLVNGFLVAWAGIPPFVVTLGTLGIATGFGYLLNNGQEISAIPGSVTTFGNDNLGGWVPVPVLITAVITIWCGLLLAKTRFGAYTLSIGDSREAVVRAGINDRRYLLEIYTLSGVLAGVAAVLVMARLGAGSPDSGRHRQPQRDRRRRHRRREPVRRPGHDHRLGHRHRHHRRPAHRAGAHQRPAVLARGRCRRGAHRRRLHRPAPQPQDKQEITPCSWEEQVSSSKQNQTPVGARTRRRPGHRRRGRVLFLIASSSSALASASARRHVGRFRARRPRSAPPR